MGAEREIFIKVAAGMPEHPKVAGLSDAGFRLLIEAWCWCKRNLTDGQIPAAVWRRWASPKARRELLDSGLAVLRPDGDIAMHDYTVHQTVRAKVESVREARRTAGAAGARARWDGKRHSKPHGKPDDNDDGKPPGNGDGNGMPRGQRSELTPSVVTSTTLIDNAEDQNRGEAENPQVKPLGTFAALAVEIAAERPAWRPQLVEDVAGQLAAKHPLWDVKARLHAAAADPETTSPRRLLEPVGWARFQRLPDLTAPGAGSPVDREAVHAAAVRGAAEARQQLAATKARGPS